MQSLQASTPVEEFLTYDVGFEEISLLPIDHPGAHDPEYRAHRDMIARLSRQFREDPQHVIPLVDYTPEETAVWQYVYDRLETGHARHACASYLEAKARLGIDFGQTTADGRFTATDFPIEDGFSSPKWRLKSGEGHWELYRNQYWVVSLGFADGFGTPLDIRAKNGNVAALTYSVGDPDSNELWIWRRAKE